MANNSTDVPLRKEGYTQVKGLIETIENDRNADVFREPVDWEGKYHYLLLNTRKGRGGVPAKHARELNYSRVSKHELSDCRDGTA